MVLNEKFMNCGEFRKEITSGNDLSDDLIKHKLEKKKNLVNKQIHYRK